VDGCTVVPGNPSTRARLEVIKKIEQELGLIEDCRAAANEITHIDIP
jgi:hypothetical protein